MLSNKKITAAVISLLIVCTLVFSALFIAVESSHECSGDECPICQEIHACVQTLQVMGTALAVIAVFFVMQFERVSDSHILFSFSRPQTLITLKVKLTD